MNSAISDIFAAFQCPVCKAGNPEWFSPDPSRHAFATAGKLTCSGCKQEFPVHDGYLDFILGPPEPVVLFQWLMQQKAGVAVYEDIWRPLGYFIGCGRSLPKDIDHVAELTHRPTGIVLDLACGPGNVTRRIARRAPNSIVIGFDLSREMLDRAVKLTRKEGLKNVYYMRGSALNLPFKPETFGAVSCCGALQLFPEAIGEVSRTLKPGGEFVVQTTIGPRKAPLYVRLADRILNFSWFYLDDLKQRLYSVNLNLVSEKRDNINYIFQAAKTE